MPRIGQNPLREEKSNNYINDIVCIVVTHLPNFEGYHKERFEIVRTCLHTMRSNINRTHTFYVWDNGSCDEFRDWLYNDFRPDITVLSKNIGKTNARTMAISSLPVNSVICYSDDDILYYPNWFNPQMEILTNFPNVAAVSGYPLRVMFRWGNKNTLKWANDPKSNCIVETGRMLPDEWEMDYAESVGQDINEFIEKTKNENDILLTYNKHKAYATAHHCQFIGYAAKLLKILKYDNKAMGDEKAFDNALDMVGLRLSTMQRLCRHMGNVMDDKIKEDIFKMTIGEAA